MPAVAVLVLCAFVPLASLLFAFLRLRSGRPSVPAVLALSLGCSLIVLALATATVYALPSARGAREAGANLIAALTIYIGVYVIASVRWRLDAFTSIFGAGAGLLALWFVGFYTALLVACSFGDCL